MAKLGDIVEKIRAKNAGPFWVTVDIFCGDTGRFDEVVSRLDTGRICTLVKADIQTTRRFDIEDLAVIKFSFVRKEVQGSRFDRDMHGAQMAVLFAELDI
ncbi:MAG: DUF4387 family protein [Alphaproteobacteria bacterium]